MAAQEPTAEQVAGFAQEMARLDQQARQTSREISRLCQFTGAAAQVERDKQEFAELMEAIRLARVARNG